MVKKPKSKGSNDVADTAALQGCIAPGGCLQGVPISAPFTPDLVKILCSNGTECSQTHYLHPKCYEKWEADMLRIVHRSRAVTGTHGHKWSNMQILQALWRQGVSGAYRYIYQACPCPCGGTLRRDVDDELVKAISHQQPVQKKEIKPKQVAKPHLHTPKPQSITKPVGPFPSTIGVLKTFPALSVIKGDNVDHEAKTHFWDNVSESPVEQTKKQKHKSHNKRKVQDAKSTENKSTQGDNSEKPGQSIEVSSLMSEDCGSVTSSLYKYDLSAHIAFCELTGYEYCSEGEILINLIRHL